MAVLTTIQSTAAAAAAAPQDQTTVSTGLARGREISQTTMRVQKKKKENQTDRQTDKQTLLLATLPAIKNVFFVESEIYVLQNGLLLLKA